VVKLIVTLVLWFVGLIAVIFLLDLVGVPERIIGFAATGAFFGILAHIRSTENWKALRNKDLFSRSTWKEEVVVVRNAVHPDFKSTSERAWFIVLATSLMLMLLSYMAFGLGHRYNLLQAISRGSRSASPYDVIFLVGCAGAVAGAFLSYLRQQASSAYRATLGRIVAWVRNGA
jgi:hypothetical protein